jgi:subtilisin-like proprotein convertase family protein
VTRDSARITWSTNEAATSVVHYGAASPPGATAADSTLVSSHSVTVSGLTGCSDHVYSVESTDTAGNTAQDTASGGYYRFKTGENVARTLISTDTPVSIPDNNLGGGRSTVVVPDLGLVQGVTVTVNVTHTFDGDLVFHLNSPAHAQVTLVEQRGSGGDNFTSTVFDDAAATSIAAGSAPFSGSFRPESPLSALIGTQAAGVWELVAIDGAQNDAGTIDGWALNLTVAVPCAAAPGGAKPVADGSFGTAMKGSRANAAGSAIVVTWDVATCSSADHHILYGDLANVASMTVAGASCDLGTSGLATWTGVPAGDLWFVVVGDDDGSSEGSWGIDGNGAQRGGGAASGLCGVSVRDDSGACP